LALATINGGKGAIGDMINGSLGNIFKTSVTAFLVLLFQTAGITLVFPFIYFYVILAFSIPAIVVTGKWGFGAMKASMFTTIGRWLKTLGLLILAMLFNSTCTYFLNLFENIIFQVIPYYDFFSYISAIVSNIVLMYFILTQCVWFINKHYLVENLRRSSNNGL